MGCWTSTQCPASNQWLFYKNQFKHHPIQVYSHHFRCVEKKFPNSGHKKILFDNHQVWAFPLYPHDMPVIAGWYLDHQTVCNWSIAEKLSPWFFLFFFTMFFLRISKFFLTFCWMFDNFQVCLKDEICQAKQFERIYARYFHNSYIINVWCAFLM